MPARRSGLLAVLLLSLTRSAGAAAAPRALRRLSASLTAPAPAIGSVGGRRCRDVLLRIRGGSGTQMSRSTAWAILFGATGFELASTGYMHQAQGFSKPLPSLLAVLFYAVSFYSFNLSLRALELSVAYAVWSAVVMAALAVIGMTVLGESVSVTKIAGISAIILGTVLLSTELQ